MAEYTASAYEDGTNVFKFQDAAALHPNGTTAQYYRGDGSLATFPSIPPGVTVVQTTGTSTANVMSQKAVTDAIAAETSARQEADNNLGQGISDLDQRLTSALSDVYNDLSRSISEGLDNEARARIESINGEGQARYEADQTLGTAIQNLGAVKQNNIVWNDSFGGGSMIRIPRYFNLMGTDKILRIRIKFSYGTFHSAVRLTCSLNGYPTEFTLGWEKDGGGHVNNVRLCGIFAANETSDNYKMPTVYYDISDTSFDTFYVKWPSTTTTTRRTFVEYIGPLSSEDDITFDTVVGGTIDFTGMSVASVSRQNIQTNTPGTAIGSTSTPVYINDSGVATICTGILNHSAYINTTFNANKEFQIVNGNFTVPLASMKDGVMYNFLVRGYKSTSPVITWNNNTSNTVTFYATNVSSTGTLAAGASKTTVISTYTFKVKNHEISRCVKIGNTVYIDMGY